MEHLDIEAQKMRTYMNAIKNSKFDIRSLSLKFDSKEYLALFTDISEYTISNQLIKGISKLDKYALDMTPEAMTLTEFRDTNPIKTRYDLANRCLLRGTQDVTDQFGDRFFTFLKRIVRDMGSDRAIVYQQQKNKYSI